MLAFFIILINDSTLRKYFLQSREVRRALQQADLLYLAIARCSDLTAKLEVYSAQKAISIFVYSCWVYRCPWRIMYFKFAMMLKSPWHFHIQLSVISHTSQTGLRSSCYMWLKCHSLPGNASACATENSSRAGRGLSRFSLSETSASREALGIPKENWG